MADVLFEAPSRGSGTLTVDSGFVRRRLQAAPGLLP